MSDFDIDLLLFGPKRCATCGTEKAANAEQFARDANEHDGHTRSSRASRNAMGRRRYARRKEVNA